MGEHDATEIQIVAHPDLAGERRRGYRIPPNAKPACSRSASHSITGGWRCPPPWRHTRVRGRGVLLKSDVGACPRTSFDGWPWFLSVRLGGALRTARMASHNV